MRLRDSYNRFLIHTAKSLGVRVGLLRFSNLIVFIAVGLGIGLAIRRLFKRFARRATSGWVQFIFSLLSVLPIPLSVIAFIYMGLQVLILPRIYEALWSRVLQAIVIVVLYVFPARVVALFLRELGKRRPDWEKTGRFLGGFTEATVALIAIYTLLGAFHPSRNVAKWESHIAFVVAICLVCYGLAKFVLLWLGRVSQRKPYFQQVAEPATFATRVIFAIVAVVIVLENFGVHLTVVWTTLGVGSVAVGLALQETLANFFAGMYILADRPIEAGDFIQLDTGQQGYVVRVGWRSTLIRSLGGNIVVVPNSTLGKAIITNYSRPEPSMSLLIEIGVAYGTDPNRVRSLLADIATKAIQEGVEGMDPAYTPSVQFMPGFGDSSLNFTLGVRVREFTDQFRVQTELRTRIVERFAKEGIEFPFPTRTLVLDKSTPAVLGLENRPSAAHPEPEPEREPAG